LSRELNLTMTDTILAMVSVICLFFVAQ